MTLRVCVAWLLLVSGCASAPPRGEEVGLRELRETFDLFPAVGSVVRDPDGAWLVDRQTGTRLVRLPEGNYGCSAHPEAPRRWRVYEGTPAAALGFADDGGVSLWWWDAKLGCEVAAKVFAMEALAPGVLLGEATSNHAGAAAVEEADAPEVEGESTSFQLDLDGRPGGATAQLSERSLTIVAAGGEVLFEQYSSQPADTACGSTNSERLESMRRADGTTLVHFVLHGTATGVDEESEDCAGDYLRRITDSVDLWIAFPPHGGAATVLSSVTTQDSGILIGTAVNQTALDVLEVAYQAVPGGMLEFERRQSYASPEQPFVGWSWTFQSTTQPRVILAADDSYGPPN